jgi:hypothetical protein
MKQITHQKYLILSMFVMFLFILSGLFTLEDYGMGWDEVVRWKSGDLKLAYYETLFSDEAEGVKEQMVRDRYPGLFDLPLAWFNKTFGGNRMMQGHIWSILFGALGLVATGWLARIVFNARTAFYAVGMLAVLPLYYGHAMINPKDIPFTATYTLGLACLLSVAGKLAAGKRVPWVHVILCGVAIGAAGASRVPGLVLIGFCAGTWGLASAFRHYQKKDDKGIPWHTLRYLGGAVCLAGLSAFVTVLLFFPRAQMQLFSSLPDVATQLHSSAAKMPLLYGGQLTDASEGPITYAHGFFILSTPIWMLLLLIGGAIALGASFQQSKKKLTHPFVMKILFLATGLFPWIYILVTHPALHDGMRHMLFAVPPLVIVMAISLDWMHRFLLLKMPKLIWLPGTAFGICVLMQIQSFVEMHPYPYVSFNLLAGERSTIPNRYESEYWCTSSKHLLEALPTVATPGKAGAPVNIRISGALDSARAFVPEGFQLVDSFEEADYYLANTYLRSDLYAEGQVVYKIERGGIPIAVIKKLR